MERDHFWGCFQKAILTPGSGSYRYVFWILYGITEPNPATQMNTGPFLPDPDPQPACTKLFRYVVSLANWRIVNELSNHLPVFINSQRYSTVFHEKWWMISPITYFLNSIFCLTVWVSVARPGSPTHRYGFISNTATQKKSDTVSIYYEITRINPVSVRYRTQWPTQ